jgi:Ca2+-binding RTX toxin-like protein
MRARLLLVVALAAALSVPAVSNAATLTFDDARAVYDGEDRERNKLTIERGPGPAPTLEFTDAGAPIEVFGEISWLGEEPCARLLFNKVRCFEMPLFQVRLGRGSDIADVLLTEVAEVWGGDGNDDLQSDSLANTTRLYGEGGDDTLSAGGEGGQVADGGPGNDTVRCCGFAGGGTMRGGSGNDRMTFYTYLLGGMADIDGGPGSDTIVAGSVGNPGTVVAGSGNDDITIIDGDAAEWPSSATGSYTIWAGDGKDTIRGGSYDDAIDAGSGPDVVHAAGGGADVVTCGAGADTVTADEYDQVADDCEVRVAPDA